MKVIIFFMLVPFLVYADNNINEEPNIRSVILDYFSAYSVGDINRINQIFHPNLVIKYLDPATKKYSEYTMANLAKFMTQLPERWKVKGKIHSISYYKTAAQVHATITIGSGKLVWTDFIGLLKIDGTWTVVTKVSHGDKITKV